MCAPLSLAGAFPTTSPCTAPEHEKGRERIMRFDNYQSAYENARVGLEPTPSLSPLRQNSAK